MGNHQNTFAGGKGDRENRKVPCSRRTQHLEIWRNGYLCSARSRTAWVHSGLNGPGSGFGFHLDRLGLTRCRLGQRKRQKTVFKRRLNIVNIDGHVES